MGRNKKLAKNTGFVVIGNLGSKLIGFFMLPLYTHWLSPADYGVTDIIGVYAGLLLNVIAFDVSDAIFVFPIGATQEKIKQYYSSGFFFQIFCSLVGMMIFYGISCLPMKNTMTEYTWFIYAILISSLFQKYIQDFCRGINKMSVFSFTGIIQSLSIATFSLLLIPTLGILGFVVATIFANTITALFTFIYSKSYKYLSISEIDMSCLKEMLVYSIPLIPTAVMWWLVNSLNRPLLEQYSGLFMIGLLAVANKLPTLINMLFGFFQQAWIVTVVEEYKKPDFSIYFNKVFRIIFFVQVLGIIILSIFSKPFIQLMTSEKYLDAYMFIPIIGAAAVFSNTSAFLGTVFTASRQTKYTFYSTILGGLTAVALNFLLIPSYGVWGACAAIVASHLVSSMSRLYYSGRFVEFNQYNTIILSTITILMICMVPMLSSWTSQILSNVIVLMMFLAFSRNTLVEVYAFIKSRRNR